ncbi:hypothetical protein TNCV_424081 [Trichonephila clavipes]|nr:hypothetical protein TNCV_424081 [Trichonephila clavipes]
MLRHYMKDRGRVIGQVDRQPGKFKGSRKTSSEQSNGHKSSTKEADSTTRPERQKTTKNGTNRAAERRTVRSKQTTSVRPCPYYLRSRVRQPEGFQRSGGTAESDVFHRTTSEKEPQYGSLRR